MTFQSLIYRIDRGRKHGSILRTERKLCNCLRGKRNHQVNRGYPACCLLEGRFDFPKPLVEKYWEAVVKELQRKHPEWVMEAYLL